MPTTPISPANAAHANCSRDGVEPLVASTTAPASSESRALTDRSDDEHRQPARADACAEVGEAPCEARGEREKDAHSLTGLVAATASSWFAW